MILQAPYPVINTSCILPNSDFGDSRIPQRSVTIGRTMTGRRFSYVKSNSREKLIYTLSLSRLKALELKAFLSAFRNDDILIIDHTGSKWSAKLLSNPFEFAQINKTGVSISLEFEGTPIETDIAECNQ